MWSCDCGVASKAGRGCDEGSWAGMQCLADHRVGAVGLLSKARRLPHLVGLLAVASQRGLRISACDLPAASCCSSYSLHGQHSHSPAAQTDRLGRTPMQPSG